MSTSTTWMDESACLNRDPDMMQPDRPQPARVARAQAVCGDCPVRRQCADAAEGHQAYGIWAGRWHGPYEPAGVLDVLEPGQWDAEAWERLSDADVADRLDIEVSQVAKFRALVA